MYNVLNFGIFSCQEFKYKASFHTFWGFDFLVRPHPMLLSGPLNSIMQTRPARI